MRSWHQLRKMWPWSGALSRATIFACRTRARSFQRACLSALPTSSFMAPLSASAEELAAIASACCGAQTPKCRAHCAPCATSSPRSTIHCRRASQGLSDKNRTGALHWLGRARAAALTSVMAPLCDLAASPQGSCTTRALARLANASEGPQASAGGPARRARRRRPSYCRERTRVSWNSRLKAVASRLATVRGCGPAASPREWWTVKALARSASAWEGPAASAPEPAQRVQRRPPYCCGETVGKSGHKAVATPSATAPA
mmetsp:Transcript_80294/g.186458  ORF Transcript_80294/g.186458 Transcript_80294/m.186458 type:complete len:259 (+) Transcript_80294:307-1083(+)